MTKISNTLEKKLLYGIVYDDEGGYRLTNGEFNFIWYLILNQDEHGIVYDVNQKEVCKATGMSKASFYNYKYSLESKGIVKVDWGNIGDCRMQLRDNELLALTNYKEGYTGVNFDVLKTRDFYKLPLRLKVFIMHLFRLDVAKKDVILTDDTLRKFKVYNAACLDVLYALFDMERNNRDSGYVFIARKKTLASTDTTTHIPMSRWLRVFCRNNTISYTAKAFKDSVRSLVNQNNARRTAHILRVLDEFTAIKYLNPRYINAIHL